MDIGNYINEKLDDFTKRQLLINPWFPPKNYKFPFSVHIKNGKEEKRYARQSHLDAHNWLLYSDVLKGYFCKYCPLFLTHFEVGYKKNVSANKLIREPVTKFAKLLGKDGILTSHENCDYHKVAVEAGKCFLKNEENPNLKVSNQVCTQNIEQIKENRLRLVPILETIILLGKQNMAFRGHRDDGKLNVDEPRNEGNFRELLKYRVHSGDDKLRHHLENSSSRATYISKTTQNELIHSCGEEILSYIIQLIQQARFYSIIFDETTDISHISQITFIIRYVVKKKKEEKGPVYRVQEDFVGFLNLLKEIKKSNEKSSEIKASGENIGKVVNDCLAKLNLRSDYCVGIGTDGCPVMVSELRGAVKTVMEKAPNAVHAPCHNHMLNLSLSKSSLVQAVRNAIGIMKETIEFFGSAKRNLPLQDIMGKALCGLCETRWNERHEGVIQFRLCLPKIVESLEFISNWDDIKTSSKAKSLIAALCDGEFIITTICLSDVLGITLPLSNFLQKTQIDLKSVQNVFKDTMSVLESRRKKCSEVFNTIFEEALGVAEELDTEIKIRRKVSRQKNRDNFPSDKPVDFYRQSIYIPILDNIIEDLKERLPQETLDLYSLSILFPSLYQSADENDKKTAISKIVNKYSSLFNKSEDLFKKLLVHELEIWHTKWIRESYDDDWDALKFLENCDRDCYPIIGDLLQILATLPSSAASAERSFSTLRRIKTWLRSTMTEDRLVGLALMNVHHDIKLNVDSVIDRYASTRVHRLDFKL